MGCRAPEGAPLYACALRRARTSLERAVLASSGRSGRTAYCAPVLCTCPVLRTYHRCRREWPRSHRRSRSSAAGAACCSSG
eukprot:scaffold18473_cov54-Phaeocystis_antarctica.AAC.7